ncbi:hypothetical protein HDV05_005086 [Chytridiales sp. JEL 0842]|nr:hypothetical protein HDV05_005086 [Chytridiales sp. JEL 0842]
MNPGRKDSTRSPQPAPPSFDRYQIIKDQAIKDLKEQDSQRRSTMATRCSESSKTPIALAKALVIRGSKPELAVKATVKTNVSQSAPQEQSGSSSSLQRDKRSRAASRHRKKSSFIIASSGTSKSSSFSNASGVPNQDRRKSFSRYATIDADDHVEDHHEKGLESLSKQSTKPQTAPVNATTKVVSHGGPKTKAEEKGGIREDRFASQANGMLLSRDATEQVLKNQKAVDLGTFRELQATLIEHATQSSKKGAKPSTKPQTSPGTFSSPTSKPPQAIRDARSLPTTKRPHTIHNPHTTSLPPFPTTPFHNPHQKIHPSTAPQLTPTTLPKTPKYISPYSQARLHPRAPRTDPQKGYLDICDHPPEDDYITRPMSPHPPFLLTEHLKNLRNAPSKKGGKKAAPVVRWSEPEEEKDNFQSRIQALFLPSLFGSSGDLKGSSNAGDLGRFKKKEVFDDDEKDGKGRGGTLYSMLKRRAGVGAGGDGGDLDKKVVWGADKVVRPIFPPDVSEWKPPKPKDLRSLALMLERGGGGIFRAEPLVKPKKSSRAGSARIEGSSSRLLNNGSLEGVSRQGSASNGSRRVNTRPNGSASKSRPTSSSNLSKSRTGSGRARSARARSGRKRVVVGGVSYMEGGGPSPLRHMRTAPRFARVGTGAGVEMIDASSSIVAKRPRTRTPIATIDRSDNDVIFQAAGGEAPTGLMKWRFAIYQVIKSFKIQSEVMEDKLMAKEMSEGARWLSLMKDQSDLVNAMRVRRVLEMQVGMREEADLDVLEAVLGKFKAFSKMPPSSRQKLYNACQIEVHPRGTVLIREGHQAKAWYIILYGEVLQQTRPDTPTVATLRLTVGQSTGDFNTFAASETRIMRSTCLMRTEVLRIDKPEYVSILREAKNMDTFTTEFFSTVPAFFNADKSIPAQLSQRSIVRRYEPDTLILKAGETPPNVYFIVKGKVRALHLVTFVKCDSATRGGGSGSGGYGRQSRYTLVPFTGQKLGPRDEVVRELASVVDLIPGQSFPPLGPSKVFSRPPTMNKGGNADGSGTVDQGDESNGPSSSSNNGLGLYPDTPTPPAPFHFIVLEKVECVVISRQDLIELCPTEVLKKLLDNRTLTDVSNQEIEERYLTAQGWRGQMDVDTKTMFKDLMVREGGSWSHPVVNMNKERIEELIQANQREGDTAKEVIV